MAKKTGLGRGIDAIFLDNAIEEKESTGGISTLRLSQIDPAKNQPRKHFEEASLASLADSIAAHGVLQPILVRPVDEDRYVIVAGERRWRAAKLAGLSEIPVLISEMDEKTAAQIALIENIQREELNPIEEAMGLLSLTLDYAMTQEEISSRIGRSRSAIANTIRLLDLPREVQSLVIQGALSAGHARTLLGLRNRDNIAVLADLVIKNGLSVRETEIAVKRMNAQKEEKEDIGAPTFRVDYVRELEQKMTSFLCRRVKISAKGANKSLTLYFDDNEDLDELLTLICGSEFTEGL